MKTKYLLTIITILFLTNSIFASHMQGGEVTYKWMGKKKYEVTAKLYRDCQGIPLISNNITFTVLAQGITPINIPFNRKSIEELSYRCKDSTSVICDSIRNGFSSERHTFIGYVDFDDSTFSIFQTNNICEIYFSISIYARTSSTSINNPGFFYLHSMLNICQTKYKNSSPQFENKNAHLMSCNEPFQQNFGAKEYEDYDSVSYELIAPMTGFNTYETYVGNFSNLFPVTPYCPPIPGSLNCRAYPTFNPPRGFYFNNLNADIIFTPTNCIELAIVVIKTNEYRKDSTGKWQLIGFVNREIQLISKSTNTFNNYAPKFIKNYFKNYEFKTRKETCLDFETYDTISQLPFTGNLGYETDLKIFKLPTGATFKYVDSTQRLKTGRFCWTVPDSIYSKLTTISKRIPVTIELRDNFCDYPYVLQKSFTVTVLPPDSIANLNLETYLDRNNDSIKNQNEKGFATTVHMKGKNSSKYISTNDSGLYKNKVWAGNFKIGIMKHPYIVSSSRDTTIQIIFDSTHYLSFGANINSGIYGRIYNDSNGNCKYDNGEPTFQGVKVFTDSNQYVGISDVNGIYFINAPVGSYNLRCGYNDNSMKVNCPLNNQISITTYADSAHLNNDFGISKNPNYTDIGIFPKLSRLTRGGTATLSITCKNLGHKKMKNITTTVGVINNLLLNYDNKNQQSFNIKIDSLDENESKVFNLSCFINQNLLVAGDKVCFEAYTDQTTLNNDSIPSNNYEKICGIVNAPYDPNHKLVSGDSIKTPLDQLVTYNVQFQNTGTDTAIRVVVTDTIDIRHLNLENFKLNWSDYPCDVVFERNIIHFIFNNIKLPYFTKSGNASIGSFNFTLGINPNTKTEKQVTNKVSIFFDFEEPVITKPSIFQIKSPVEITKIMKPEICINNINRVYIKPNIKAKAGNIYTVELKDSFNNFISIGNKTSVSSTDSINITIPSTFKPGQYAIRILSSNPSSISIPFSGTDSLTIYKKPLFNVLTNLNQNAICLNDSIIINGSNLNLQYKFVVNGNTNTSFANTNKYVKKAQTNDNIKIIGNDAFNCKDTQTIIPIVNPIPNSFLSVANRKTEYCSGDSVFFNFQGGYRYDFFENNLLISSSNQNSFKLIGKVNSTYQLKSYNQLNCSKNSDTLNLIFNPLPIAQIYASGNKLSIGPFIGNIKWYKDNVLLQNSDSVITNASSGTYYVVVTDPNGCSNQSDNFIHENLSLSQHLAKSVKIYPNPANNFLMIENFELEKTTIELMSISGKTLISQTLERQTEKINLSNIQQGVYLLKVIQSNGEIFMFKLIIQK